MNELRDVFAKYKAVVFFDTETTGLEAESCQIIELAAIRVEKTERGTLRIADSRAIDDVAALFEVCKAMDAERSDLLSYVNVFGYNPKYGVSGKRIEKVAYWPQNFNKYMQAPSYTLPAKLRQRRR